MRSRLNKIIEAQNLYTDTTSRNRNLALIVPEAFVRGIRYIGYRSNLYAIAELVDNSIQAYAERVDLVFGYAEAGSNKPTQLAVVQHDKRAENGFVAHVFGRICTERGVEHRPTKPYHPWTNGQAERMVRTIKDATVRSFHYATLDHLRRHIRDWLIAYNYTK